MALTATQETHLRNLGLVKYNDLPSKHQTEAYNRLAFRFDGTPRNNNQIDTLLHEQWFDAHTGGTCVNIGAMLQGID